jgi:hypothetical protein
MTMKKSATRLFRIYTENKNYERVILPLLDTAFDGFTCYRGEGYWRGEKEPSLLIEVYTNNRHLIHAIAERIKHHNKQEAVLITETDCTVELV